MTTPLDTHKADRVGKVRVARVLSDVISPPTMFAAMGFALAIRERPGWAGFGWGLFYGLLTALLPILFVLFLLKTGRIGDLHMSRTQERHLPYIVAIAAAVLALLCVAIFDGPDSMQCLAAANIVVLTFLGLINTRWLISIHTSAASATWMIAASVYGMTVGLLLLPLVGLIVWARLYLKRHTPAQVLAGLALGLSTILVFRQAGCFLP